MALEAVRGVPSVGWALCRPSESGVCLPEPLPGGTGMWWVLKGRCYPPLAQPRGDLPSSLHAQGGSLASEAVPAGPSPGLGPGLRKRGSPAPTPTKHPVRGWWGGRGRAVFGMDRGLGVERVSPCVGWGLGWAHGKGQTLAYLSRRELLSDWRFAGSKPQSRGICD